MSPVELSPAFQTASTQSTLWAQPSKEWVIPAKPKPGRKPKQEPSFSPIDPKDHVDEVSCTSRRVQNRAAQRAFRERKQSQLAELQARLHSYEQGEIERNIALQNIAKKMKEENEELRKENQALRDKIARMEQERDGSLEKDRKRLYDSSTSSPSLLPADNPINKRARVDENNPEDLSPSLPPPFSSSSSLISSPDTNPAVGTFTRGRENHPRPSAFPTPPAINDILSFTTANETATANTLDDQDSIISFTTCILCSPDAPCVCRDASVPHSTDINNNAHHQSFTLPSESLNQQLSLDQTQATGSILDNLPAFQAPVPIRRTSSTSRINPVFPVTPISTNSPALTSKCSGDPENCMACADDNFGKAFCQAIGQTVNSTVPCVDCPKRTNHTDNVLVSGCCGDIRQCGSCGIAPMISSATPPRGPETISTDDAWRQLKSHPNVAFADLTLLADVVARRSKCVGSRVVISPAPTLVAPDRNARPSHHEPTASRDQSVLLTDPDEVHLHQKQRQREPPPQLVPQHVLVECRRRRVREVNADGVREALRLLDQKFAHMR